MSKSREIEVLIQPRTLPIFSILRMLITDQRVLLPSLRDKDPTAGSRPLFLDGYRIRFTSTLASILAGVAILTDAP